MLPPPLSRCPWALSSSLETHYHDTFWGRPLQGDRELFAMLCLEGAQAGLSWKTILAKKEGYYATFFDFNIEKVASLSPQDAQKILDSAPIVRNRLKVLSVIHNAQASLRIIERYGSLTHYLWSFVNHQPITHTYTNQESIPASSPHSHHMATTLKKEGFRFVGPVICYAFMQAVGMVNDHLLSCCCYPEVAEESKNFYLH